MNKTVLDILMSLRNLLFPTRCIACRKKLLPNEESICGECLVTLPYTQFSGKEENPFVRQFYGQANVIKADAFLFYHKGLKPSNILYNLKYYGRDDIGIYFGRIMANNLLQTNFFEGIDAIIPIPLSKCRIRKRGYNQSEKIAKGVAEKTGIPIWEDYVTRTKNNPSQTHLRFSQRQNNVKDIFQCLHPEKAYRKHLLIVDDVATSCSTLIECMKAIGSTNRYSVLTLAISSSISHIVKEKIEDFNV